MFMLGALVLALAASTSRAAFGPPAGEAWLLVTLCNMKASSVGEALFNLVARTFRSKRGEARYDRIYVWDGRSDRDAGHLHTL